MKIDIGCCEDLCEATGFVELQCNAFDEPVIGMFLPPGWGAVVSTSVDFYCPRHNPALKKTDAEPDVDFCMASVVDDPVNPDCKLAKGIKEGAGFHCPANAGHSTILTDIDLRAKARERAGELKGEQIGTVLRDSDGVVRIELEPGEESEQ